MGIRNRLKRQPVTKALPESSASAASSSADDALAWLKIIQNATADLTADIRASKGGSVTRSDEAASFGRNSPQSSPGFAGDRPRHPGFHDDPQNDDYRDERMLAQKLSYRNTESRRSAPPQTLWTAVMPYVAATGVFAFLAGSAAVYFLTGSSSADVKAKAAATAVETQFEAPTAPADQPGSKKGGLQRAALPAASADSTGFWGSKAEEQGTKSAKPEAPAERQTWSDTVETFKQFVKPDQR